LRKPKPRPSRYGSAYRICVSTRTRAQGFRRVIDRQRHGYNLHLGRVPAMHARPENVVHHTHTFGPRCRLRLGGNDKTQVEISFRIRFGLMAEDRRQAAGSCSALSGKILAIGVVHSTQRSYLYYQWATYCHFTGCRVEKEVFNYSSESSSYQILRTCGWHQAPTSMPRKTGQIWLA